MTDSSEVAQEIKMSKLQKQNQQLQQENKVLQLRATGVQVLGKVLQESQEESEQLKQQVEHLKDELKKAGIEEPKYSMSYHTGTIMSHQSELSEPSTFPSSSCGFSSSLQSVDPYSSSLPDKQLQFSSQTGSLSLCHVELHTKELHQKFKEFKDELEKMNQQAHELMEKSKALDSEECKAELKVKLCRLKNRIQSGEKEVKTREALIGALVTQEDDLKAKWAIVEAEQLSQENIAQQLHKDIEEDKEELEQLQDEITFFKDTVLVNKQQLSTEMELSSSSDLQKTSIRTAAIKENPVYENSGDEDLKRKMEQVQLQCNELQRQMEELRNERDEAVKQKDEILDVNHLWDTQYRQLQAETLQEISDLKQKVELLTCDDSQKRFDKLWLSAKSMVDNEKKAKEQVEQEKHIFQKRCEDLNGEIKQLKEQNKTLQLFVDQKAKHVSLLQENLSRLSPKSSLQYSNETYYPAALPAETVPGSSQQRPHPSGALQMLPPDPTAVGPASLNAPPEIVDQIEMLKTQLRVYVDDFQSERNDRERAQAEKQKVVEELNAVKEQVVVLEAQVEQFQEDWKREKDEKERLQRQRGSVTGSGGRPQGGFEYQGQAQLTHKAQAIAEQQAKLKIMREDHDLHERLLLQEQQQVEQEARALANSQQQYWPGYASQFSPRNTVAAPLPATTGTGSGYAPYMATGRLDYTPEQLQRLQQQQQQQQHYLHARGPIQAPSDQRRPLDDMFKGGEVQPDSDIGYEVIDSPSGNNKEGTKSEVKDDGSDNQCPRCLRAFTDEEQKLLLQHIEKCIS